MPGPTVDPRTVVSGVGGQQLAQQRRAQLGHRGADRQLHRLQVGSALAQRAGSQPVYLGRELRPDLLAELLFSSPVAAGGAVVASVFGGRASQMASLTATISSDTSAKR